MANPLRVTKKTGFVGFKVTPDQYQLIADRAERCGVPMAAWMRVILLQVANSQEKKGYIRIREPKEATI